MPHDKNGQLIEVGDVVRVQAYDLGGQLVDRLARVTEVQAQSTTCNLRADYAMVTNGYFTANEVELVTKRAGSVSV